MRNSWFVVLGLFSLLLAGGGCTATASVSTPTVTVTIPSSCAVDGTVTGCSAPSTGYSCTSTDAPDQSDPSLSCSVGVAGNAGATLYCCLSGETFPAGTCAADETVSGCAAGSYGFSCASSDTPDQTDSTLVCSTGVPGNAGSTLFCCTNGPPATTAVIPSSCAVDGTVTGCSSPSTGYSCTSTDAPDQSDPSLSCSVGVPGNAGSTLYCCLSAETFAAGTCAPDETVAGCAGGSYGFSCASSDTPDQTDSTLVCSTGVAGNAGSTLFCCTSGGTTTTTSTCATDSTVSGCASPSAGYSCTGTDTPDQADPTLGCSVGVAGNAGSTLFCCLPATYSWGASTCAPDETVSGCAGGSYGFSCTGSDTPDQTDSTLVCSTGVAGNAGSTLFCCTN